MYRIEDLSHLSGTTVRTIRAYTDRGLLPRPERRGRANVYGDAHLARLRQIADLLERGYSLASIKELLAAWDAGTGLGGVLGLVGEVDRPWSDEQPVRMTLAELTAAFHGVTDLTAIEEALGLGVLEPVPGSDDEFLVPSPQELAVAVELHAAGVPLTAITGHLRELREQVEHISERFLEFTTEYVFQRFLHHPPSDAEAEEAAGLVRRLRPLAQQTVDAELARAMRQRATEHIRRHLGSAGLTAALPSPVTSPVTSPPADPAPDSGPVSAAPSDSATRPAADVPVAVPVALPAATVEAVRELVGTERVAAFVAAAADREVAARRMDALADDHQA
ncbi:MerR family transcriptional regulator [Streptomyces sp. PLK6-54]|uniref:MerR family transcriptional regulator n=1 Tax=Actinacidiphila acidipaludis TaxID=2873382 RepID=A0ABS7Q911_9ACTN|nr:MerR family transcriptional regulator [Streptomyces acidipaludis]